MIINESKSWSNLSKGTRVAEAWKSISWKKCESYVRKMQIKIAKAVVEGKPRVVKIVKQSGA